MRTSKLTRVKELNKVIHPSNIVNFLNKLELISLFFEAPSAGDRERNTSAVNYRLFTRIILQ